MYKELILLINCIKNFQLWYNLGLSKLRMRYLRTKLGPLVGNNWNISNNFYISLIWSKLWGKI